MTRASRLVIQAGLVVLTLLLGRSVASAKPKIAILGLEAGVGANGRIDPDDTQFAKDLTKELRLRANNSTMYEPTKDQRELADEKLMSNCGAEHPSCMAPIGNQMGAEAMLFGKVENAKDGWKVTLKLISVSKKQQIASLPNELISAKDAKGAGLAAWVKNAYRKLTGETSEGSVIIKVTNNGVGGGSVLVDKKTVDTLKSGEAKISLPEGRYTIGVDADGFKLWEKEGVTVSADKPVELTPTLSKTDIQKPIEPNPNPGNGSGPDPNLKEREGTVAPNKLKTTAKIVAAVGLGGAAVTGGWWLYWKFGGGPIKEFRDTNLDGLTFTDKNGVMRTSPGDVDEGDCGGTFAGGAQAGTANSRFKEACGAHTKFQVLGGATIGLAVVGAGALVYVMVSKDSNGTEHASGRQKKRRNLIVTPVISPDGTGATLQFDW